MKTKKLILPILSLFLFTLLISPLKAQSPPSFESTSGEYTIENILSKFNVFSFGDVTGMHIVGPIIAQKDMYNENKNNGFTFSDYDQGVSSYIKGKIARGSRTSSSYSNTNPTQYVGNVNDLSKKVFWGDDFVYQVNGADYVNNKVNVFKTDDYVDFDLAKSLLTQQSLDLLQESNRSVRLEDIEIKNGISSIRVNAGEKITIPEEVLSKINRIELVGKISEVTLIQIPTSQNVTLPGVISNHPFGEYGADMNLIFNLPNTKQVTLPNAYGIGIGHIVAVNANVIHRSGNYNGGIIADNLDSKSEGHMWPYSGGKLLTEKPKTMNIIGKKYWYDDNNHDRLRPKEIIIHLYENDQWVDSKIVTEKTEWNYSFLNLPIKNYYITEEPVFHYTASYDHYDIYNTLDTANLEITKKVIQNNQEINSEEIFYTALFDAQQKRISDVKAISTSIPALFEKLPLGSYWIKETDEFGIEKNDSIYEVNYSVEPILIEEKNTTYSAVITNSLNTHIEIIKTNENEQLLEGAQLELYDAENHLIDAWTSTKKAHQLIGRLDYGTYRLHEVKAPAGYETSEDILISVKKTSELQTYTFVNRSIEYPIEPTEPVEPIQPIEPIQPTDPQPPGQTPNTSDRTLALYAILLLVSLLGISALVIRKYEKNRKS